jgi:hypothetical protein
VYYGGHGSRTVAPDSLPSTDGKIETMVPHDERAKNAQAEIIHGIPDRTIDVLLSNLATAKENNIVRPVSNRREYGLKDPLDCCHSGGVTRRSSPSVLGLQSVEPHLPIPENLSETLWVGGRRTSVCPQTSPTTLCTPMFCWPHADNSSAQECISEAGQPCSFFTNLIKQLRSIGLNRITYAELLDLLPTLPNQNPQCEGANKEHFIFGLQGPDHDPKTCALTVKQDGTHEVACTVS